jgi:Metallo-beta-lactamase superfamily
LKAQLNVAEKAGVGGSTPSLATTFQSTCSESRLALPVRSQSAIFRRDPHRFLATMRVIATPGHCDDHIVLYDPKEKVLLAGDAFMGSYFATPNPDVDSRKWLMSLERLMGLDVEILVEGHGHIHTLRTDIPDFPGVVIREDPKVAISQKLDYLRWLREQIEAGFQEQLPVRVIEASCFPWGKRTSWESCATDECIRLLSLGHFSRTELVRSFVRTDGDQLPTVYEVRISGGE